MKYAFRERSIKNLLFQFAPLFFLRDFIVWKNNEKDLIYALKHPKLPKNISITKTDCPQNNKRILGVLVIGESASRHFLSSYGYNLNTTPCLDKRKVSTVLFDDVITAYPYTVIALKYWLTDLVLTNNRINMCLVSLAKAAGYNVDVISAQRGLGKNNAPVTLMLKQGDTLINIQAENANPLKEKCVFDEQIIPYFNSAVDSFMDSKKKDELVILHLYGSHFPFRLRFPDGEFTENVKKEFMATDSSLTEDVVDYATSIRYTDFVLDKIISKIENLGFPCYLIYFSDHGELVGHNGERREARTTEKIVYEVPFCFWHNNLYDEHFKTTVTRANNARHVPLQGDKAFYGFLEMMQISWNGFPEKKSFLSPQFPINKRYFKMGEEEYLK